MSTTIAPGTIGIDHMWKRFRADRTRPIFRDEVVRLSDRLHGRSGPERWRWALRDIEADIAPGEAVGLFGTNGSGKSTLLKILTRVMYPTAGDLRIRGRVGALIEVKAGIHPDLTGHENVFLYGSILGLRRAEIAARFDDIVDFAELSDAVDRQLKFYSSGMSMRLGFAVAAFLQPDILLVDEVLAVGDATFQQRCLDRMRAVLNEGTTLVFVSHDLASIEAIATRGIWMHYGEIAADGPVRESLAKYRGHIESTAEVQSGDVGLVGVTGAVSGPAGESPATQAPLRIDLRLTSAEVQRAIVFIGVTEGSAAPVFSLRQELQLEAGRNEASCTLATLPVPGGTYYLWIAVTSPTGDDLTPWHPVARFNVIGPDLDPSLPGVMRLSPVFVEAGWSEVNAGALPPSPVSAQQPDFTVIIPTWNRAELVTTAVRSVLAQTDADFELIVVDDGSTDATLEVLLTETDPRLRILCHDHEGVSAARNAGVAAAGGRNIAFLDSDDEAQPGWLATLAALLADPGVDVALCGSVVIEPDGSQYEIQPGGPGRQRDTVPTRFLAGCFALRRRLFEAVGGYDPSLEFGENTELALRLFTHRPPPAFAATTLPLVRRRAPATRSLATRAVSARTVLDRYEGVAGQFPKLWASYHGIVGVDCVYQGRNRQGRRHFVRAVRSDPWTFKHALRLVVSLVPGGSWLAWRRRSG